MAEQVHQDRWSRDVGERVPVGGGQTVEEGEHAGPRRIAAAVVAVEADRLGREVGEAWGDVGPQGVGAQAVDHNEQHVEERQRGLALQGRQRVVQVPVSRGAERGGEAVLARPGLIHEAEPRHVPGILEREKQRQISRERGHRHV